MKRTNRQKELSAAELEEFFQQLALFFKSGIPAWEGLALLGEETGGRNSELFRMLSAKVADGNSLSDAFLQSGRFPGYAVDMVRIGERTGRMQEIAESLHAYYEGRDALARELRTSVVYPLVMAGMVLVVIFVLTVAVMPVFEQVFKQLGLAMNPFSLSLLRFGQAFSQSALVILIVVTVLVLIFFLLRFTKKGRAVLWRAYDTSPLTRKVAAVIAAERFAFSMSLMLESGIYIVDALHFAADLEESERAKARIVELERLLGEGKPLQEAIFASGIFEESYNGMIVAGLRTGTPGTMLMEVALRCRRDAELRLQRLLAIIEPALVALLCVLVGLVILSVMLPLAGILSGM
ncbi:MAG: type II secretion system F family protein [Bacteroidales bacterium]|nr:type II secretion system F family protein [Bacteroidales bacterium]